MMRGKFGTYLKELVGKARKNLIIMTILLLLLPVSLMAGSPPEGKVQPQSTTCYLLMDYDETYGAYGYAWASVSACQDPLTHWLLNKRHAGGGGSYYSGFIVRRYMSTEPFWELYRAWTYYEVRIYTPTGLLLEVDWAYARIP